MSLGQPTSGELLHKDDHVPHVQEGLALSNSQPLGFNLGDEFMLTELECVLDGEQRFDVSNENFGSGIRVE